MTRKASKLQASQAQDVQKTISFPGSLRESYMAAAFSAFGYRAPYTALTIFKQTKDSSIPPSCEEKDRFRRHMGHQLTCTYRKQSR